MPRLDDVWVLFLFIKSQVLISIQKHNLIDIIV